MKAILIVLANRPVTKKNGLAADQKILIMAMDVKRSMSTTKFLKHGLPIPSGVIFLMMIDYGSTWLQEPCLNMKLYQEAEKIKD